MTADVGEFLPNNAEERAALLNLAYRSARRTAHQHGVAPAAENRRILDTDAADQQPSGRSS